MSSKYEIRRTADNQFDFVLKAANLEVVLTSERYTSKQSAHVGVHAVRANCTLEARYERRLNRGNQPYFVLKAANGEVLGTSQAYYSAAACNHGIEAVKRAGITTTVVEVP